MTGARLSGARQVPGYDPDLLAQARCYDDIALAGPVVAAGIDNGP